MSRGHGSRQRAIIAAMTASGLETWGLTVPAIARAIAGREPSGSELRATRRAVAALVADGTLSLRERRWRREDPVARYRLGTRARQESRPAAPRYMCVSCGRRAMHAPGRMCVSCLLSGGQPQEAYGGGEWRRQQASAAPWTDPKVARILSLALDPSATEEEALAAFAAARRLAGKSIARLDDLREGR